MPSPQAKYFERIDESRRKKGKTGPEWHLEQTDQTPVIMTKYSERIKPSSLSRWWSLERGNYGLDDFSLHELRHTYLTLLAERACIPRSGPLQLADHDGRVHLRQHGRKARDCRGRVQALMIASPVSVPDGRSRVMGPPVRSHH